MKGNVGSLFVKWHLTTLCAYVLFETFNKFLSKYGVKLRTDVLYCVGVK